MVEGTLRIYWNINGAAKITPFFFQQHGQHETTEWKDVKNYSTIAISMLHKDYPTYITNSKETWKKNDNNKQARHRRANRPNQWSLLRGPTSMFRSVEDFKNSQLALILILSAEIFTKFSNWKNISSLLEYLLHWKKKRSSFMVVYRKYVNCKYARLCLRLSFYKSQRMRCNLSFSSFSSIFRLRIRIFKMAQKISYFSVKSTTTWSNAVR